MKIELTKETQYGKTFYMIYRDGTAVKAFSENQQKEAEDFYKYVADEGGHEKKIEVLQSVEIN